MKKLISIFALVSFASTALAAVDTYKLDAEVTKNGQVVGIYSSMLESGSTGIFQNTHVIQATESVETDGKGKTTEKMEPIKLGYAIEATPVTGPNGKIELKFSFSSAELLEMKHEQAQGVQMSLPQTNEQSTGGGVMLASGESFQSEISNKRGGYVLTFKVTKQ